MEYCLKKQTRPQVFFFVVPLLYQTPPWDLIPRDPGSTNHSTLLSRKHLTPKKANGNGLDDQKEYGFLLLCSQAGRCIEESRYLPNWRKYTKDSLSPRVAAEGNGEKMTRRGSASYISLPVQSFPMAEPREGEGFSRVTQLWTSPQHPGPQESR